MPAEQRYEVNKPDVVEESVDGEALIVHLGTGTYYSSRGAGDSVWQLIASGASVAETALAMGHESPAAVERFVSQLIEEELIRPRSRPVEAPPMVTPQAGPLELEKYTDMQELLLLDPIHDVEEAGWPRAKPALAGD